MTRGICLIALALSTQTAGENPPGSKPTADDLVRAVLAAHNRERSEAKLPPLTLDRKLTAAAQVQADDMAKHQKMAHEGSDGSSPFDRIKRQNYRYRSAGENIAEGQRTVEALMRVWMDSPPHRENILGKFEQAGIAVARDDEGTPYWCVDFATPWPKLDPARASTDLVDAINKERASAKRQLLATNPKLASAALSIAQSLALDDSLEQSKGHGPDLVRTLKQRDYRFSKLAEAAASGHPTAADVVKSWMDSPSHKQNVLGDFTEAGVGYATASSGVPYWCLILAKPLKD
jgi:uncharacterized protein YkwD